MSITATGVLDKADSILKGEPARIIGYGAAVVIYLVAKASGHIADQTPEQALVSGVAGVTTLIGVIESIRHFVFSPNSVEAIVTTPPTASGPIEAALDAGVELDNEVIEAAAEDLDDGDTT